jgi:hypothetical protein
VIFKDDEDRERFLATLAETCQKTGWVVHAYCLMGNPDGGWSMVRFLQGAIAPKW